MTVNTVVCAALPASVDVLQATLGHGVSKSVLMVNGGWIVPCPASAKMGLFVIPQLELVSVALVGWVRTAVRSVPEAAMAPTVSLTVPATTTPPVIGSLAAATVVQDDLDATVS